MSDLYEAWHIYVRTSSAVGQRGHITKPIRKALKTWRESILAMQAMGWEVSA